MTWLSSSLGNNGGATFVDLEAETKHYESIKSNLLAHHDGKFALLVRRELLGVYDTPERPYAEGINWRGNVPMLIQPITKKTRIELVPAILMGLISTHG